MHWDGTGYSAETNKESVVFGYDGGELSTITTATTTYTFDYDAYGNTKSVQVGTGEIAKYIYNPGNGKLKYTIYQNGYVEKNVYDHLERLVEVCYTQLTGTLPTSDSVYDSYTYTTACEFIYDSQGNVSVFIDHISNKKYVYENDQNGNPVRVVRFDGTDGMVAVDFLQTMVYTTSGLLSSYSESYLLKGSTYSNTMTYLYDEQDRLQAYYWGGTSSADKITYIYDTMDRVRRTTAVLGGVTQTHEYEYRIVEGSRGSSETGQIETNTVTIKGSENTSTTEYTYTYDTKGNITEIKLGGELKYRYSYDNLGQLLREDNAVAGKTYVYTYDNGGNITSKKTYAYTTGTLGSYQSNYTYSYGTTGWKDQLTSYRGNSITYDKLGNPLTYYNGASYSFGWTKGRLLSSLTTGSTTASYTYNADGIRIGKIVSGISTEYIVDNGQILAEVRGNTVYQYFYDAWGAPIGMKIDADTYLYEKNLQGDIVGIYNATGKRVASYTYDAWGNQVKGSYIGAYYDVYKNNPFRYRGYYWDSESGFYYLQSRYYDPVIGRFLNADVYVATGDELVGYNMYAYCNNNPVNMTDPTGDLPSWATKFLIGAAVIAAAAVLAVATAGTGTAVACFAAGALKGAVTGALMGAASGAVSGAVTHRIETGSWDGVGEAMLNGAADGFMTGAITGFISGGMSSNQCFVAGTAILAATGYVLIENIQAGDYVWASDPDTGETALKKVVQTFVNETNELVHVTVNGEEIICTTEHPFYSPVKGWTAACQLRAGDILVLVNGEYVVVEQVQHEILETPVATYNFEVEDFHTYYVGESAILVHNLCKVQTGGAKEYTVSKSRNAAFREAKRYSNIPMSEQPVKVIQSVDRMNKAIPGRTYIFKNGTTIMEHSAGHVFENGIRSTSHFNILGSKMHFFF